MENINQQKTGGGLKFTGICLKTVKNLLHFPTHLTTETNNKENKLENTDQKTSNPQTIQFPSGCNVKPKLRELCDLIMKNQARNGGLQMKVPMYAATLLAVEHMIKDLQSQEKEANITHSD